jgi:hypothetical protein
MKYFAMLSPKPKSRMVCRQEFNQGLSITHTVAKRQRLGCLYLRAMMRVMSFAFGEEYEIPPFYNSK